MAAQKRQICRQIPAFMEVWVTGTAIDYKWVLLLGWWKCSKIRLWWWLPNCAGIVQSTELCSLNGGILWNINYISIKWFKILFMLSVNSILLQALSGFIRIHKQNVRLWLRIALWKLIYFFLITSQLHTIETGLGGAVRPSQDVHLFYIPTYLHLLFLFLSHCWLSYPQLSTWCTP